MKETLKERHARTKPERRAKMKARAFAISDLRKLGVQFDYLRPYPSDFMDKSDDWVRSRTTYYVFTRSVLAMYVRKVDEHTSERVIELATGHFYLLRTIKKR